MEFRESVHHLEEWAGRHKGVLAIVAVLLGVAAIMLSTNKSNGAVSLTGIPQGAVSGGNRGDSGSIAGGAGATGETPGQDAEGFQAAIDAIRSANEAAQASAIARDAAIQSDYQARFERSQLENSRQYQDALAKFQQGQQANTSTTQGLARLFEQLANGSAPRATIPQTTVNERITAPVGSLAPVTSNGLTPVYDPVVGRWFNSWISQWDFWNPNPVSDTSNNTSAQDYGVASDAQSIYDQTQEAAQPFWATYGANAPGAWEAEHERELAGIFSPQHDAWAALQSLPSVSTPMIVQNVAENPMPADAPQLPDRSGEDYAWQPPETVNYDGGDPIQPSYESSSGDTQENYTTYQEIADNAVYAEPTYDTISSTSDARGENYY